ncbi:MAG: acyl-CoA dehydrogenase family protein [Sporichthyaceae bacterium]
MISFEFSPEQQDFARELRRFASTELAPYYLERAGRMDYPWEAHRALAKLGVLGIGLPERWGGTGEPDPIMLGLAAETLAYGDVNVASAPVLVGLVAAQLAEHGRDEAIAEYVPRMISGDIVAAIAVTEPGAGSDAAALRTVARPVPGGWRITGEKIGITHATTAAVGLVYARRPDSAGHKGISCFAVPLDAAGVTRSPTRAMGCLPLGWGGLAFDDVFVPDTHLVGEEDRGFASVMHHFDFSRPALGLMCLGAAQASLAEAVSWSRDREAFGQPIAAFQGVSFPLAEHRTLIEAARWLCYRALWLRSVGEPHTMEAAMGKWWPPLIAKEAIETAWVTHGNLGYSEELPLAQRFRDVAAYLVADGSAAIQKRIIANAMIGPVASAR